MLIKIRLSPRSCFMVRNVRCSSVTAVAYVLCRLWFEIPFLPEMSLSCLGICTGQGPELRLQVVCL